MKLRTIFRAAKVILRVGPVAGILLLRVRGERLKIPGLSSSEVQKKTDAISWA
jgi:hypothetical protein